MSMKDVLDVMKPGIEYSVDEIINLMCENGFRLTNRGSVMYTLNKLCSKKKLVLVVTSIYMVPLPDVEFSFLQSNSVRAIIEYMMPGQYYNHSDFLPLYDSENTKITADTFRNYIELMVKCDYLIKSNEAFILSSSIQ